jgi:hypothetical protein
MRKILSFISLAIIVAQFSLIGCKKDELPAVTPLPPPVYPSLPPLSPTPPPVVNAGPDIRIEIPTTDVKLVSSVNVAADNIKSYHWEKISGPESYFLESGNLPSPKVFWMEEGEYEFEVSLTDNQLRMARDTMKVRVFSNLKKHVINNLTRDAAGFSTAQIPVEVTNNIKWVFARSGRIYEQADAGPLSNMNYDWGGYYYNLLPGNQISVFSNYSDQTVDLTIYY